MSAPRIGSLFSGYGGLDMGAQAAIGGELAWHCEIEPAAARVLAAHHPDVPNLGDITAVDWPSAPAVDVLTGRFPCQDVSAAGRRAGMRPDSRSGLWAHMARAINVLRPELVVIENVRGLLSADAACDVEPCPWCLGDHEGRPLRALGAVLGDLAVVGYDARWCGVRASDAGAPHERFRVIITAWPASADAAELGRGAARRDDRVRTAGLESVATTADSGHRREPERARSSRRLDTERAPVRAEPGRAGARAAADTDGVGPVRSGGARGGRSGPADDGLAAADTDDPQRHGEPAQRARRGAPPGCGGASLWGDYGPAVRRWELTLGRLAPAPTMTGRRGGQQLAPAFVEWLMGLPAGHVTDVPGLSRNDQLKLLGNGVVPQQAELALRYLLGHAESETRGDVA